MSNFGSANTEIEDIKGDVEENTLELDEHEILINTLQNNTSNIGNLQNSINTNSTDINNNSAAINGIKNNTSTSTLKTTVDANSTKNSYPSADATKLSHITSDATTFKHNKFLVGEQSPDQLIIQHGDINSGSLSTTDYSMRVTAAGELRLNVPTGRDYEFRINNVFQYNNTQIKNLIDNITVAGSVNLDSIRNEINNINIQSTFLNYLHFKLGDIGTDTVCIQHKDLNGGTLADTHGSIKIDNQGNLKLNVPTSKTFEFQINNVKQYDNIQIKNLVDNITVTGAVNLDTITDNISADDLSVQSCNLRPVSIYCYAKRVHSTTDTDNEITLTTSGVDLIYQNILSNGIVYNSTTGVWTVPTSGLYEVIATLNINCGSGPESVLSLFIKEGTTNILKARSHVSRAEGNNNTAMQLNMNGIVRLEASTNYNFVCASNNTGTGTIQNDIAGNNCLIIKGAVLENSTTVPSNWGEVG